jgi:hypothetical protein
LVAFLNLQQRTKKGSAAALSVQQQKISCLILIFRSLFFALVAAGLRAAHVSAHLQDVLFP